MKLFEEVSAETSTDGPPPEASLPGGEDWEVVPEDEVQDDEIIGRVFKASLWVIAAVIVGLGAFFLFSQDEALSEERSITVAAPEAIGEISATPTMPFSDVTQEARIDFVHNNGAYGDKLLPESLGGGVAFLDFDSDGDQDLLFVDSGEWAHQSSVLEPPVALYRNEGGFRFTDVTRRAGLEDLTSTGSYGMGVAVGDYDGDGDPDLFLTAVGSNRLLRNDSGRFLDVTDKAGVAGLEDDWSTSAAFLDVDGDRDLDLVVCNYVRWSKEIDFELDFRLTGIGRAFGPPQSYEGSYPYLYRNDGSGVFTEFTAESGLKVENPATGEPMAKSLALAPADVDGDGWMDFIVANDTVRNFFFHNQGGTFEEIGEVLGVAYDRNGNATGAMGVDVGHYRNDGNLGFLIGNFANEMSTVYMSQDDPLFYVDEAISEGIGAPSRSVLTFGLFLFDADLDGRLDLFQANGHLESEIQAVDPSQTYRQAAQIFWNGGDEGFLPLDPGATGDLSQPVVGRGAAYADLDDDGDLDIVLTQVAGPPLLLRNDQNSGHHWLRLRLVNPGPNWDAIGAWVTVRADGISQRRQVMPTRSYLSQVELALTFGLGDSPTVESVTILWPDGLEEDLGSLPVDRLHRIERKL